MLPMIAVPTTAGTGSETQSFALISDAKTHVKMACGDKKASFRVALLDPALTVSQPPRVTALTGIDAIAHALETYVTKVRNPVSLAFSREAWLLLGENFARVLAEPDESRRPQRHAIGRVLRRAGDRELDARRHPRAGQPADDALCDRTRPGDRADAAARDPLQRRRSSATGIATCWRARAARTVFPIRPADSKGWPISSPRWPREPACRRACPSAASSGPGCPSWLPKPRKQWTGGFNPRRVQQAELLQLYEAAF